MSRIRTRMSFGDEYRHESPNTSCAMDCYICIATMRFVWVLDEFVTMAQLYRNIFFYDSKWNFGNLLFQISVP